MKNINSFNRYIVECKFMSNIKMLESHFKF